MRADKPAPRLAVLFAIAAIAALSAGCSPLDAGDASDEMADIMPSRAPGVDYLVIFSNRPNLLINGDLLADRKNVTGARLKRLGCRDPRMLHERAEPQEGSWPLGRQKMLYYSEWTCR